MPGRHPPARCLAGASGLLVLAKHLRLLCLYGASADPYPPQYQCLGSAMSAPTDTGAIKVDVLKTNLRRRRCQYPIETAPGRVHRRGTHKEPTSTTWIFRNGQETAALSLVRNGVTKLKLLHVRVHQDFQAH